MINFLFWSLKTRPFSLQNSSLSLISRGLIVAHHLVDDVILNLITKCHIHDVLPKAQGILHFAGEENAGSRDSVAVVLGGLTWVEAVAEHGGLDYGEVRKSELGAELAKIGAVCEHNCDSLLREVISPRWRVEFQCLSRETPLIHGIWFCCYCNNWKYLRVKCWGTKGLEEYRISVFSLEF